MYTKFIKRILDILFAIILLPFLALFIIIFAPIIYLQDKGSIFYNAKRLGKNEKIFIMYKFRTMKVDSPDIRNKDGSTYNGEGDSRVTNIGKFLRKTSLDEFPQLLNILKGDMSFIGPRPDLPEQYNEYVDEEKNRLNVLPGITGYNQAYYRNSISWKERIKNDIYYVDNMKFSLDVKILFKTFFVVVGRKNIFVNNIDINDEIGDINNAI